MGKENFALGVGQGEGGSCVLVAYVYGDYALFGGTEGLCHAGCSGCDEGGTGNCAGGVIIEGSGVSSVRSADGDIAAGDGQTSVRIDTVAGCLNVQVAAGNRYAAVRGTHSDGKSATGIAVGSVIEIVAKTTAVRTILHVVVSGNVRWKMFKPFGEG